MPLKITNRIDPEFEDEYVIRILYMLGDGDSYEEVSFPVDTEEELEALYKASEWAINGFYEKGKQHNIEDAPMFPYKKDSNDYEDWIESIPSDITCRDGEVQAINVDLLYYDRVGILYKVIHED